MRIVFISNYFNHHQKTLSEELNRLTNGNYTFVETVPMTEERQKLGWGENEKPSYVISAKEQDVFTKIDCADVILLGSAPKNMIRYAMKQKKLIFRYSERPLKNGTEPLKYLPRLFKWHFENPFFRPVYLLCASAYAAGDYAKFGLFKNKSFQWGYFPDARTYSNIETLLNEKDSTKILWAGRFLDWKHPEAVVKVAKKLKTEGYSFSVDFIGNGAMEDELKKKAEKLHVMDKISFLGSMSPNEVREHMEKAGIFLFTSDHKEGWGAVLNEAMNSGCAVVGSHEVGSVPFLIKNGQNGLIYESFNQEMLYEKVKFLLDNIDEQRKIGQAAYDTITKEWNGKIAAERLLQLAAHLESGQNKNIYESGPCRPAPVIKEGWF